MAGSLLVNPAPIVVTGNSANRLYGGSNPTLTGTLTGIKNNDPITATYASSTDPTTDVGSYPIAIALTDPMNRLGNYTVTKNLGALTINRAP